MPQIRGAFPKRGEGLSKVQLECRCRYGRLPHPLNGTGVLHVKWSSHPQLECLFRYGRPPRLHRKKETLHLKRGSRRE